MKLKKSAVLMTALFLIGLCGLLLFPLRYTDVLVEQTHCRISSAQFNLQWKHSVEKTRWVENYQREQQHFILRYTDLISFGAGTPNDYPIIFQKDGVVRMQVNRRIEQINWIISKNMQGSLVVQQKVWPIFQQHPDYTVVQITSQQQPLWKAWQIGECL